MSWGLAIQAGGQILSSLLSGGGDSSSGGGASTEKRWKKETRTDSNLADMDVLFSAESLQRMSEMTDKIGEWADSRENFIQDNVLPFQQQAIDNNKSILATIDKVNTGALEQMSKDLMSNGLIAQTMQARVDNGGIEKGGLMDKASSMMKTEIDNLPSVEERVGQALTAVEGQFSAAGKALTRDFASRGQSVSQASKRDLLMNKAKAKAGATGAAAQGAREERMNMLNLGVNAGGQVEAAGQSGVASGVNALATLQNSNQAMLGATNNALVDPGKIQESEGLAGLEAGLTSTSSQQAFGTRARTDSINNIQKGTKDFVQVAGAGQEGFSEGVTLNPQETDQ
jgi:hypothetical protein